MIRLVLLTITLTSLGLTAANQPFVVYTYDSLSEKGGLGPKLRERFEAKTKSRLKFVSFASSSEALNQILLEGEKTKADALLGIDTVLVLRAKASGHFGKIPEMLAETLKPEVKEGRSDIFLPFDYGYLAFVYHSKRVDPAALFGTTPSLKALSENPKLKKRIALPDPRTSSLGQSFLAWTFIEFGKEATAFWKNFSNQLLQMPPEWSEAYGLFLKKKVDFVLSYTTSPAYHMEKEANKEIKALIFPEGHYVQIEGALIVRHSKNARLQKIFLETLLDPGIQKAVATTNWMYPAVRGTALPASFEKLPQGIKPISIPSDLNGEKLESWLKEWKGLWVN